MPRVCVFDVNETLLDLSSLDPHFERAFGDASVRRAWFLQVLQSAMVATITDAYSEFGAVGAASLQMTAERLGVEPSEEDRQKILGGMRELPPPTRRWRRASISCATPASVWPRSRTRRRRSPRSS